MGKGGLRVTSADSEYSLRLRGYVQTDSRTFISDDEGLAVDNFLVRRARPILEGQADHFGFRLMVDFAQTAADQRLFDAYAEYRPGGWLNLRAGKFKAPVGLERLKSRTDLTFVEANLPTNLAPNRDVGVMAYGEPLPGLTWELGLFNGVEDNGRQGSDVDDEKEWAARLFAHPFAQSDGALRGLGIGVAGTWGEKEGSLVNRQLGDYRSPSQARAFRYRASSFAAGDHWRLAPQGYFYAGPFGLLAEYTVSTQDVRNGADLAEFENRAWEAQFRYILTGQDASHRGWPSVGHFDPRSGQWGAWEVAFKYGELTVDDAAFPLFADPAAAVSRMENYGVALHGYLSDSVKLVVDYEHTRFDGGAAGGLDRETEQVVLARLDYKF